MSARSVPPVALHTRNLYCLLFQRGANTFLGGFVKMGIGRIMNLNFFRQMIKLNVLSSMVSLFPSTDPGYRAFSSLEDLIHPDVPPSEFSSSSIGSSWALASGRHDSPISESSLSGKIRTREKLWKDLFLNPSHWWDHRSEKVHPRYPDFSHKGTQVPLWLDGKLNPPWVQEELASMKPGCVQLHVFTWNKRLTRFAKAGKYEKTLNLFKKMLGEGTNPDKFTFVPVLNACTRTLALEEGRWVHAQIIQFGCESDVYIGSCLVNMYAKCRSLDDAWRVFNNMPTRDVVAWTAMIMGLVKCGQGEMALKISCKMQQEGVKPDPVIFVGLVNACASVGSLEAGRRYHEQIIQADCESDIFVSNSLVDMYAKCGNIEEARKLFIKMPTRDVVAWTAMIGGYASHGHSKEALVLFENMCLERVEIDELTLVSLLSACSHGGLVEEGLHYFESMSLLHGICPTLEHYTCVVDLLGRAGRLGDAQEIVDRMPFEPDAAVWKSLLSACRLHGNVEMGERAALRVQELDPKTSASYALLSKMYAAVGRWENKALVYEQMLERCVAKQPGCSWIEVNNEVHSFLVGESKHPRIKEILDELSRLLEQVKEAGYVPDTKFAFHDINEEKKVVHLWHHSEKLAIAFALISTPALAPILIFKNLRVCGDCHTATKFISKVVGRKIIIRDPNRFHHFEGGQCSCRDYW